LLGQPFLKKKVAGFQQVRRKIEFMKILKILAFLLLSRKRQMYLKKEKPVK